MFTTTAGPGQVRHPGRFRALVAGGAILATGGIVLAACSGASSPSQSTTTPFGNSITASAPSTTEPARHSAAQLGATVSPTAPLIVRTGDITLQLRPGSVMRTFNEVSAQVVGMGGFVSSSSTSGSTLASLVLRVPSDNFSRLVTEVSGDGHAVAEQLNGQDVTGESINLRARIINLTTEEASLRSLMTRAGSIPAILAVQDQLFSVEGEIEQLTAQESSLVNQASYATLALALQSAAVASHPAKPGAFSRAVTLAGHNTVAVLRSVLLAAGWAFPAAVVALAAGAVLWTRRRRRIAGTGSGTGPAPAATP